MANDAHEYLRLHRLQQKADKHLKTAIGAGSPARAMRAAMMVQILEGRLNEAVPFPVAGYSPAD
jgi:hypothetical protein